MDVAIDTSTLSERLSKRPDVAHAVLRKIAAERLRLVLPLQVLSEAIDSSSEDGVVARLSCLAALAQTLGPRFVITQDVGDQLRLERARALSSTPALPARVHAGYVDLLKGPEILENLLELRGKIRTQQRKDTTLARDKSARQDLGKIFKRVPIDEVMADLRNSDFFWNGVFVEGASRLGKYKARMRAHPGRYATAVMVAGFTFLNAMGSIYALHGYGRHQLLLRGPKRGDWLDSYVAACSVRAKVFLSEDDGQRRKVNFIATTMGLPARAQAVEEWLAA
jgi:hypothetical protein